MRRAQVLTGVGLAALVVGGAVYVKWTGAAPPIVPDGRVYPEPNGYDACRAATAKLVLIKSDAPVWKAGHDAEQRLLAARHAADLQALRRAIRMEYMNPPAIDYHDDYAFVSGYRNGARLLAVQARHALANGKTDRALNGSLDAIELGTRIGKGGAFVPNLAGLACCAIGGRELEACIPRLSSQQLGAGRKRLERLVRRLPSPREMLQEERRAWYGTLDNVFRHGMDPAGAERPAPGLTGDLPPEYVWRLYPRPWIYAESEALFAAVEAELRKPRPERKPPPRPGEPMTKLLLNIIEDMKWVDALDANEARLRLFVVDLALREHRAAAGSYPASLDALGTRVKAEFQRDPFSRERFRYRRTAQGFLLYSVGPDGKDDGGRPMPNKDVLKGGEGDLVVGRFYAAPR